MKITIVSTLYPPRIGGKIFRRPSTPEDKICLLKHFDKDINYFKPCPARFGSRTITATIYAVRLLKS
jgi:hypothetical protein